MDFKYTRSDQALVPARRRHFALAIAAGLLVALFCFLSIRQPVCFGDCDGYVLLMGKAPWTKKYWELLHHGFRGWTVPVLFSAFGRFSDTSAQCIVVAQAFLLLVATIVFSFAAALRFASGRRWWIGFTIGMTLAFQHAYLVFSSFLLSDSLAWTFVLLLLAGILASDRLIHWIGGGTYVVVYLALGWVTIGARDANQQLLLAFTAYLLVLRSGLLTRKQMAVLAAGVLSVCAFQSHWARNRFHVNMEDILVAHILPDPQARDFFRQHGMPGAYAQLGESMPLQPSYGIDSDVVKEGKRKFESVSGRYLDQAPRTYALWLLSHPISVAHTLFADRAFIFVSDFLPGDTSRLQLAAVVRRLETGKQSDEHPESTSSALRRVLLVLRPTVIERIPVSLRFALFLLLPVIGVQRNGRRFFTGIGGFGLLSGAVGIVNACSGFLADAWTQGEMERHAAIGNMLFSVGLLMLLLWAAQEAVDIFQSRLGRQS